MWNAALALLVLGACSAQSRYYGKKLGELSQLHHGVSGAVYAVDARTLFIDKFTYDGVAPAAYFYVGSSKSPSARTGVKLRDERGGTGPLRKYRGEGVTLSLPDGHTLPSLRWFSVWCDEFAVNFGDVSIPKDLEYPKPAKVGALRGVHGVSSDAIVVVDAQTLLVPNFSYDGEAPDAKFWVGRGEKPSPQGIRIPDENGKEAPLRKYDKKTIVLTLPGELTVFDIGHFGVWCEAFTVDFGHVALPHSALDNVPPSLKMLGVSPQSRNQGLVTEAPRAARPRRPIARLDATTYRPALALAAGPRAAPDHHPAPHATHRRAYNQPPPDQQLLDPKNQELPKSQPVNVQPSQEIIYQHDQTNYYNPEVHQYDERIQQKQETYDQRQYQHDQQNRYDQTQYNDQQYSKQIQQEDLNNQYQQYLHQRDNRYRQQEQSRHDQYQDAQRLQRPQQNQAYQQSQYYPEDERALYERQQYERQLYEQQQQAYGKQIQEQRRGQDEPFRYRLVPYSFGDARDGRL